MTGRTSTGVTRWWWLRHAPVPCPVGRIHGRLDVTCDLSDTDDFRWLATRIPANAVLVESGLIRCRQTAGGLEAAGLLLPPPQVEPDLMEQDFGLWQGRSWLELETAKEPGLAEFWADPAATPPPGGESFAAMTVRVAAAVARLDREHAGRDILAIAHAGTVRAALALALDLSPAAALRLAVQPLSLTRIDATAGSWRVGSVNVTAE